MPPQQQRRGVWWLGVLTLLLRIILWPFRRLALLLFPSKELDGLSPAVTAKAVQSFVDELRALIPTTVALEVFSTSGFAAVRNESNSLILVYLHSPLHWQGDACRKRLLLTDSVLQFFNENASSLKVLGVSIHTAQGAHLAQMLHAASYPLMALLQPNNENNNNALQLIFRAEGSVLHKLTAASLIQYLTTAIQRHESAVQEAEARRLQREQEAQLRQEQDLEYQETLRADQERQRLVQEAQERERELHLQAQLEAEQAQQDKQQKLENARALLIPEPASGGTRVRFVLPTGAKIDRRFESTETIKSLRAFLTVHFDENNSDNAIENIGLSTNYPKRSYDDEVNMTLEEAGLSPQAVLMVQNLDA